MSGGAAPKRAGERGEQLVADDLERRGWRIWARNYRCRFGELDIVAQTGEYLVFVEVKLRRDSGYGPAGGFVTPGKQRRLRTAAQMFLQRYPTKLQPRFDVAEVYAPQGSRDAAQVQIAYIENAF